MTKAMTTHRIVLSFLAVACILKTFTLKRFKRAVLNNTSPPKDLVKGLNSTMQLVREQGLEIPAGLKARAERCVGANPSDK